MIDPEGRLWAGSGDLLVGGPYTWNITDLDQRRHFAVRYHPPVPVEDVEETEDICLAQLRKHVDQLGPGVLGIVFSQPDGPVTLLTDREHDVTRYVNNHPLSALALPFPVKTIHLSSLTELDRFGPNVDLVSYQGPPSVAGASRSTTRAAFKYWYMFNGMFRYWHELNSWSRLPRDHPHIVPFDAVILDHHTEGIVGFTTQYVPGGTLQDNNATTRPFRLRWLRQLLSVVDDLNYKYGMMHQDIAPRNLLVDEEDNLRLFDFNFSAMIEKHYSPEHDDIKGVIFTLYEIITLDEHFREVPHDKQDAEAVLAMAWEKHPDVKLDADVQVFRDVLDSWVVERKAKEFFSRTDTWISWPEMPRPPTVVIPTYSRDRKLTGTEMKDVLIVGRGDMVAMGRPFFDWERPASYSLKEALAKKEPAAKAVRDPGFQCT
jgi:serine/threonine protein kinase